MKEGEQDLPRFHAVGAGDAEDIAALAGKFVGGALADDGFFVVGDLVRFDQVGDRVGAFQVVQAESVVAIIDAREGVGVSVFGAELGIAVGFDVALARPAEFASA